jgi:hypothetical protein
MNKASFLKSSAHKANLHKQESLGSPEHDNKMFMATQIFGGHFGPQLTISDTRTLVIT